MCPRTLLATSRVRLTAVLVLLGVIAVGVAAAQGGYAIDSPDATPAPERSVDFQGQTHTVDSQISADQGDTVTVDVSAPDESYRVYLINSDGEFVEESRETSDATVEFDLSGEEPGSYVIAAQSNDDGIYKTFLPLLIRGYAVDVPAPDAVAADGTVDVTLDVTATGASGSPESVKAVLANDATEHNITATETDGSYVATVDASELSTGEYTVYGAVQGGATAFGQRELLGMGEAGTLSVSESDDSEQTETDTDTETETETESGGSGGSGGSGAGSGGSGGGGSGGGPADEATDTETDAGDAEGESTETDAQDGTETTEADGNASDGSTAGGSSPATDADPGEEGAQAAITPNGSSNDTGTTGADGPGFGPFQAVVALGAVLVALVVGRGRRLD